MTDRDLIRILRRAVLQERVNGSLLWGCAAAGLGLLAAIALMVLAKCLPHWGDEIIPWLWTPVVVTLAALIVGLWRTRPPLERIALMLDRRAGLEEHLSTWLENRDGPINEEPLRKAFVEAQRRATLGRSEGLNPRKHLPVRPPMWSSALWLGLLFLGCAVLMPEQQASHALSKEGDRLRTEKGGATKAGPARWDSPKKNPSIISLFTPTELLKGRLAAMDETPDTIKADTLKELEAKIGTLPESRLPQEVRKLLAELREQVRPDGAEKAFGDGSVQVNRTGGARKPGERPRRHVGAAAGAMDPAKLIGIMRERFPDEADALERYYDRIGKQK